MSGTGVAWPLDAVSSLPSYTGRMLRNTQSPFLAMASASRPLGAITGVRPGTPSTIATCPTPTTYQVTPFAGIIDLEAAAISGPYAFAFNANVTGSVTAANASNPRVDILYVQINDNAEGDGTVGTPNIKLDYLAGTAASSPVAPATPSRSFVLAKINVPTSGGGSPTITWVAPYAVAAGGAVPFLTISQLKAWTTGIIGQIGNVTADSDARNNGLYTWDGTYWNTVTPLKGSVTSAANTSGSVFVNLPTGKFDVAPTVVATITNFASSAPTIEVISVSTTQINFVTFNGVSGGSLGAVGFNWMAF